MFEKIGNAAAAVGNLVKTLVWDNPFAIAVRFGASAAVGISVFLVGAAVTIPTIAALRLTTAASGKILSFAGGERIKVFNAALLGASQATQKGFISFCKNFCFYAPLAILGTIKDSSEKFSAAFGSGRTQDDDPRSAAVTDAYQKGGTPVYDPSSNISDRTTYQPAPTYDSDAQALEESQEELLRRIEAEKKRVAALHPSSSGVVPIEGTTFSGHETTRAR